MAPSGNLQFKVRHGQVQLYVGSLGNICFMPAPASKNGKNVSYSHYTVMSNTVHTCQNLANELEEHRHNELRQTLELVRVVVQYSVVSLVSILCNSLYAWVTYRGSLVAFACCKQLTYLLLSRLFNMLINTFIGGQLAKQ